MRRFSSGRGQKRQTGSGKRRTEGRSYLRLHGAVHGGHLGGGATVGEGFGGAGRQRGLLGRRGGLRGPLNVLTVPLVSLRKGVKLDQMRLDDETEHLK